MNDRLEMPSSMSAEYAERTSDRLDWPTPQEQAEQEIEIDRKVKELLCSEAYWDSVLCGINGPTNALPGVLARIMANLDNACKGDEIGRTAILTALSQVQRVARDAAQKEVERDE